MEITAKESTKLLERWIRRICREEIEKYIKATWK